MNIISWEIDSLKYYHKKFADAEIRLKGPLQTIMRRWIINENIPKNDIVRKLDVSLITVNRLIDLFGLKEYVEINKKLYNARGASRMGKIFNHGEQK